MPEVLPVLVADVPWFFTETPTPTEGAVWCSALFAACAVLADRAGVAPEQTNAMIQAAAEALAQTPVGTCAEAELRRALGAAEAELLSPHDAA